MTNQITPNDWEDLSAYLDNQLSARERADLERRLQRSAAMRQALAELDRVRTTIRSQPRLRAPRNFTLTPQMAGLRPGAKRGAVMLPSAYPVLRLASMLATVFFIVVSMGSLYVRMYAPAPREVSVSADGMVPQGQQPFGGMGGGGGGVFPPPMAPDPAAMEASRTLTESETTAEAGMTYDATAQQPVLEVTPMATAVAGGGAAEDTPLVPQMNAQADLPNVKERPAQPVPLPAPEAAPSTVQAESTTWRLAWIVLLVVQALLAILAVVTGVAALYLRRSVRH